MAMIFEGNVNDLLYVSEDNVIKMTRLVKVNKDDDPEKHEVLDVTLTSSDPEGNHYIFNQCLGKKMTVRIDLSD